MCRVIERFGSLPLQAGVRQGASATLLWRRSSVKRRRHAREYFGTTYGSSSVSVASREGSSGGIGTPQEHEALLREANPALRLYILAALQTGARRSELIRLRWADVDFKWRTVTFPNTKNGDRGVVPMTETLAVALEALPRHIEPEARVLPERDPHALTRAFSP